LGAKHLRKTIPSKSWGGGGEEVSGLPSFEGTFVASEETAVELADDSYAQITPIILSMIDEAMSPVFPSSSVYGVHGILRNSIGRPEIPLYQTQDRNSTEDTSGTIERDGVKMYYSISISTSPICIKYNMKGSIDDTYDGYKIAGDFEIDTEIKYIEEEEKEIYTEKFHNDFSYSVSKYGVGMKVIMKVDMALAETYDASSETEDFYLITKYSIYDNENNLKYEYGYTYPE
jgi:hypothetical protein